MNYHQTHYFFMEKLRNNNKVDTQKIFGANVSLFRVYRNLGRLLRLYIIPVWDGVANNWFMVGNQLQFDANGVCVINWRLTNWPYLAWRLRNLHIDKWLAHHRLHLIWLVPVNHEVATMSSSSRSRRWQTITSISKLSSNYFGSVISRRSYVICSVRKIILI